MVSLLELLLKDGDWSETLYVSLDWDASPKKYSKKDLSSAEGNQLAGRWYCRPPALAGLIAKTQSGLFVLTWFSENPEAQFLRNTYYGIACYNGNKVGKGRLAFHLDEAPSPMNWSPKEGLVFVWGAKNPVYKDNTFKWVKLRP